jgi:hypothetical protein
VQKTVINDKLFYELSKSLDGTYLHLKVNYLNGKFVVDKTFLNILSGRDDLDSALKNLANEEGIKKYFNLK